MWGPLKVLCCCFILAILNFMEDRHYAGKGSPCSSEEGSRYFLTVERCGRDTLDSDNVGLFFHWWYLYSKFILKMKYNI